MFIKMQSTCGSLTKITNINILTTRAAGSKGTHIAYRVAMLNSKRDLSYEIRPGVISSAYLGPSAMQPNKPRGINCILSIAGFKRS